MSRGFVRASRRRIHIQFYSLVYNPALADSECLTLSLKDYATTKNNETLSRRHEPPRARNAELPRLAGRDV